MHLRPDLGSYGDTPKVLAWIGVAIGLLVLVWRLGVNIHEGYMEDQKEEALYEERVRERQTWLAHWKNCTALPQGEKTTVSIIARPEGSGGVPACVKIKRGYRGHFDSPPGVGFVLEAITGERVIISGEGDEYYLRSNTSKNVFRFFSLGEKAKIDVGVTKL